MRTPVARDVSDRLQHIADAADVSTVSVTMQEFEHGVAYWRNATPWPADLHNAFYAVLAEQDPQGNFDLDWWQRFARHLGAWKATRGFRRDVLDRNAQDAFPALTRAWGKCCASLQREGADVTGVEWATVADWVQVVAPIRPTGSPVFRGKFSHFLLPQVFPVVDWRVMRFPFGRSYRAHFEGVQREWLTTSPETQDQLRSALHTEVGVPLVPTYPVVNKIVEVCLIGRRHPS